MVTKHFNRQLTEILPTDHQQLADCLRPTISQQFEAKVLADSWLFASRQMANSGQQLTNRWPTVEQEFFGELFFTFTH